jgi:hypothetical protein
MQRLGRQRNRFGMAGGIGIAWFAALASRMAVSSGDRALCIPSCSLRTRAHTNCATWWQVDDATLEVEYHMDGWCRELQLPASGGVLSRASNVCAVPGTGAPGSRPGLVAVMANGLVMFWPDVSKDIAKNATVAFASAIDRAHSVVSCNSAPHGCLMVTDQGQLFHISVRNPNGRPTLQCAPVSQGEGVLGWGRRLVFGRGVRFPSFSALEPCSAHAFRLLINRCPWTWLTLQC